VALVLGKPLPLGELAQALSDVTGVRTRRPEEGEPRSFLGGRALSEDLKRTFRQACESALTEIGQGRQAGNIPQLLAELHKLRGMLDVFGEPGLSRLTADAETCLKTDRGLAVAEGLLDALAAGLKRASSP